MNPSFPTESCSLSNTTFPHILPLLFLLEKTAAVSEGLEPWESVEAGVDVVMFHLGAARTFAQQGGTYCSNAETKLKGNSEPFVLFCKSDPLTVVVVLQASRSGRRSRSSSSLTFR